MTELRFKISSKEDALTSLPCTCIDGRSSLPRFSSAGGSMAIILTALAAAEKVSDHRITEDDIKTLLESLTQKKLYIYYHTDTHAMEWLTKKAVNPFSKNHKLTDKEIRLLNEPSGIGCGHIKLMRMQPASYQVSNELIYKVTKVFFDFFQSGEQRFLFEVLQGDHQEKKIVVVDEKTQSENCYVYQNDPENAFLIHLPLQKRIVKIIVKDICQNILKNQEYIEPLEKLIKEMLEVQLRLTSQKLASGLPKELICFKEK